MQDRATTSSPRYAVRSIGRAPPDSTRARWLKKAAARIVTCAAGLKADLLVMGTHGRGGFHRLLHGSVTDKVVRAAT
jgi:nucleotide-binding universal stress UspA family protein